MPSKWTATEDQNLFLLLIKEVKVDTKKLAARWAEEYPDNAFQPNGNAIFQHIYKMKQKQAGQVEGGSAVKAKASPCTPTSAKRRVQKTPSSSNKRSRMADMSDEDDSGDENNINISKISARYASNRRSTTSSKPYAEDSDDDEELGRDVKDKSLVDKSSTDPSSPGPKAGNGKVKARSKNDPPKLSDLTPDSDDGDDFAIEI